MANTILTGILVEEETYSFVEICEKYEFSEEMLIDMMEHGLFHIQTKNLKKENFDAKTIARIQSARRLQEDLGINLPGVVLALELIDELEDLKKQVLVLKRHFE